MERHCILSVGRSSAEVLHGARTTRGRTGCAHGKRRASARRARNLVTKGKNSAGAAENCKSQVPRLLRNDKRDEFIIVKQSTAILSGE